mgnify:CR=1 FL=1
MTTFIFYHNKSNMSIFPNNFVNISEFCMKNYLLLLKMDFYYIKIKPISSANRISAFLGLNL